MTHPDPRLDPQHIGTPADGFVPVTDMLDAILGAVALVALPGTPEFERFGNAARCPMPQVRHMESLYQDAFGVLDGDPWAMRGFLDTLGQLEVLAPLPLPRGAPSPQDRVPLVPEDSAMVPRSRLMPIFVAGATLVQAGFLEATRFRDVISFAVCGFEHLGTLHRLALDAGMSTMGRLRFAAALETRWPECGAPPVPTDPGLPWPEKRHCIPWLDTHTHCLDTVFTQVPPGPGYAITGISPNPACPGDLLTITGTNFGTTPGLVVFRRLGGGTMEVAPSSWTDTVITVVVPAGAGRGLWLKVSAGSVVACGVVIDRTVPGQVVETFDGSAPVIEALYAANHPIGPWCVEPGLPLGIQWRVYGATHVRVEVRDAAGALYAVSDPAPSLGTFASLNAPAVTMATQLTVTVRADGPCLPGTVTRTITIQVTRDAAVSIDGMEVTQAVQHFRSAQHLTDSTDYGPDNSLPLVADKATMVRVYLRSFCQPVFNNGSHPGITGTLLVEQLSGTNVVATTTLSPVAPGTVAALVAPDYKAVRADRDATLNFLIPAAQATGRLRLTVTLQLPPDAWPAPAPNATTTVDLVPGRRLRLAFIPVGYSGPTAVGATTTTTVAAPALNDLLATLGDTLAMYPVSATPDIRTVAVHTRTTVVSASMVPAGACGPNVGDLMGNLAPVLAADGNRTDAVYVALYASGIPDLWGGCGGGNLSVSETTFGKILAHELGHAIGRPHAPCGNVGTADANYPAYEPYDTPAARMAIIGDFGLDVRDGRIRKPSPVLMTDQQEADFMSYCGGANNGEWQWTSPYGYRFAHANLPGLGGGTGAPGGGGGAMGSMPSERHSTLLWLSGAIMGGRECQVQHVAEVDLHGVPGGRPLPLVAELLDGDGKRLAVTPLLGTSRSGCGCSGSDAGSAGVASGHEPFTAWLPVLANAERVRIRATGDAGDAGDAVLWERKRPGPAPQVQVSRCEVSRKGLVSLRWKAAAATKDAVAWLQWQQAGATDGWRALQVGLAGSGAEVPLEALPEGEVRFRILVHDGFATGRAETEVVRIPARPPIVGIVHPVGGVVHGSPGYLMLWGYGVSARGDVLPDESLRWLVNGREVGRGRTVPFALPAGHHTLRVELEGIDGKRSARTEVTVDT